MDTHRTVWSSRGFTLDYARIGTTRAAAAHGHGSRVTDHGSRITGRRHAADTRTRIQIARNGNTYTSATDRHSARITDTAHGTDVKSRQVRIGSVRCRVWHWCTTRGRQITTTGTTTRHDTRQYDTTRSDPARDVIQAHETGNRSRIRYACNRITYGKAMARSGMARSGSTRRRQTRPRYGAARIRLANCQTV